MTGSRTGKCISRVNRQGFQAASPAADYGKLEADEFPG
jgi:hypothetical protein